jgi:alpha-1,3-mannosyltransferase
MAFAYEFVRSHWKAYVSRAFQLNRIFLYKWTVNWRFVPEGIFLSSAFSYSLLSAHAALLLLFAATRWVRPAKRSLPATLSLYFSDPDWHVTEAISERVSADFVMTSILSANAIGMLCARSLHYQFFAWTAWATPWLLWRSGLHPVLIYVVWAAQEWAWNMYPSTELSSQVAVACLAVQVLGVWWGSRKDIPAVGEEKGKKAE